MMTLNSHLIVRPIVEQLDDVLELLQHGDVARADDAVAAQSLDVEHVVVAGDEQVLQRLELLVVDEIQHEVVHRLAQLLGVGVAVHGDVVTR